VKNQILRLLTILTLTLACVFMLIYVHAAYVLKVYNGSYNTPGLSYFEMLITFLALLTLMASFSKAIQAPPKDNLLARVVSLAILLPIIGYIIIVPIFF
jgi:hypothetical protein